MRLTHAQMTGFVTALSPYIKSHCAELRLYGSRVDDNKKGGDIDLLLLTDTLELAQQLREQKHYLLASIEKQIGEQKVDLLIASKEEESEHVFLRMILPESVVLHGWG